MRPSFTTISGRCRLVLRGLACLQAALLLAQATLAGHMLTGNAGARGLHQSLATNGIMWVAAAQILFAILLWRPGRGPWWPIAVGTGLFVALVLQLGWGFGGRLALHLPVGVGLLVGNLLYAAALRPPAPDKNGAAGPDRSTSHEDLEAFG